VPNPKAADIGKHIRVTGSPFPGSVLLALWSPLRRRIEIEIAALAERARGAMGVGQEKRVRRVLGERQDIEDGML